MINNILYIYIYFKISLFILVKKKKIAEIESCYFKIIKDNNNNNNNNKIVMIN